MAAACQPDAARSNSLINSVLVVDDALATITPTLPRSSCQRKSSRNRSGRRYFRTVELTLNIDLMRESLAAGQAFYR